MRKSLEPTDKSYNKLANRYIYKAFLNGKEVPFCVTADEEIGYIMRLKEDKDGNSVEKEDKSGIETEELYGDVVIKYKYPKKLSMIEKFIEWVKK